MLISTLTLHKGYTLMENKTAEITGNTLSLIIIQVPK